MKFLLAAPTTLLVLLSSCATTPFLSTDHGATVCPVTNLDLPELQARTAGSVLLVRSERGTGTGWIISGQDDRFITVVTNHHVISGSRALALDLPGQGGVPVTITPVEVLKADAKADLAILRAPRLAGLASGLVPNTRPLRLGESIAVFGYPGVAGSAPTLTVERGDVTAQDRAVGGTHYVQTNANINPGNSGGPVLDACGRVVGVVVASIRSTERTKLFIPVEKLLPLLATHGAADPQPVVRERLDAFLSALAYNEPAAAAEYLAVSYVADRISPILKKQLEGALAKLGKARDELKERGIILAKLDKEQMMRVLGATLSQDELVCITLAQAIESGQLDAEQASRRYFAALTPAMFGRVSNHRIDRIRIEDRVARAIVELKTERGAETWVLDLIFEWGDWQVAGFTHS